MIHRIIHQYSTALKDFDKRSVAKSVIFYTVSNLSSFEEKSKDPGESKDNNKDCLVYTFSLPAFSAFRRN